jgi:hypothetical protein
MDGLLGNLFGIEEEDPLLRLLPPEQRQLLMNQARGQGMTNLGLALLQAGGPTRAPTGIGARLGQAGMQAMQANQGVMDRGLERLMAARKLAEEQRQLERRAKFQEEIPTLMQQQMVQPAVVDAQGRPGAGVVPQPVAMTSFDRNKAAQLLMKYPEFAQNIKGIEDLLGPQDVKLGAGERIYNRQTGQLMFEGGEKPEAMSEYQRLLAQRDKFPPESETYKALTARINKLVEADKGQNISVSVNAGGTFFKELAGGLAGNVNTIIQGGQTAQKNLQTISQIRGALPTAITGTAADFRLGVARAAETLGLGGKDNEERLRNTSTLIQGLAQNELQAAEAMKGQGQITEAERLIIRRAASGDIKFTRPELEALTNALEKVANYRIGIARNTVNTLRQSPEASMFAPFLPNFDVAPTGGLPPGVTVTPVRR